MFKSKMKCLNLSFDTFNKKNNIPSEKLYWNVVFYVVLKFENKRKYQQKRHF